MQRCPQIFDSLLLPVPDHDLKLVEDPRSPRASFRPRAPLAREPESSKHRDQCLAGPCPIPRPVFTGVPAFGGDDTGCGCNVALKSSIVLHSHAASFVFAPGSAIMLAIVGCRLDDA